MLFDRLGATADPSLPAVRPQNAGLQITDRLHTSTHAVPVSTLPESPREKEYPLWHQSHIATRYKEIHSEKECPDSPPILNPFEIPIQQV